MGLESESSETAEMPDDALSGEPESWEFWETGLVLGSIAVGAIGLVVLGWAVDRFILP